MNTENSNTGLQHETIFSDDQLSTDPILNFFGYAHLPAALQNVSSPFCALAAHIVRVLPRNAERTVALRKLLEAKDAAVRANVGALPAVGTVASDNWLERLKTEHRELSEKFAKLNQFINSGEFNHIDTRQRRLLLTQRTYMGDYITVLEERLAAADEYEITPAPYAREPDDDEPEFGEVKTKAPDPDGDPPFQD